VWETTGFSTYTLLELCEHTYGDLNEHEKPLFFAYTLLQGAIYAMKGNTPPLSRP